MRAALLSFALLACSGCAFTVFWVPDGPKGVRCAVLFPVSVDGLRIATTNTEFSIDSYRADGANSNTAAVAESIVEGVVAGLKREGLAVREVK